MRKIIALLLVALMAGCTQQPVIDTAVPITPLSQTLAGPEVAAQLNTLYGRRFPNCNNSDSQPAFLCSGVTLRVTVKDPANTYKVWDPSPTSVASGGVSFSYLRADSNFGQLAWGNTNGLIFYPIFEAPADKIDVDYMCAYPMDAWNWNRTSPCGYHASFPNQSGACQSVGVTTAEQWMTIWNSSPTERNIRQCSFDIRDERNALAGPAFYQFVRAKGLLGATGFGEQNEIVIKTWAAGRPNTLPLMAFFYVQGGPGTALADARYNQQDFYNSTNPHITVPIIRLTLPTSSAGTANFSYNAADQAVGTAKAFRFQTGTSILTSRWVRSTQLTATGKTPVFTLEYWADGTPPYQCSSSQPDIVSAQMRGDMCVTSRKNPGDATITAVDGSGQTQSFIARHQIKTFNLQISPTALDAAAGVSWLKANGLTGPPFSEEVSTALTAMYRYTPGVKFLMNLIPVHNERGTVIEYDGSKWVRSSVTSGPFRVVGVKSSEF